MFHCSPRTLRLASGSIWLLTGTSLFTVGARLIIAASQMEESLPLLNSLSFFSDSKTVLGLLAASSGVLLGCLKGHFALKKSAKRLIHYYNKLPRSSSLLSLYPAPYYLLLGTMMGLGMLLNFLQTPTDVRGVIDITIGSALLIGGYKLIRGGF